MEGGEAAQVTASGMAAISTTLLQLCASGDEIVSSRTIYGGTYALFNNLLPRFGIKTRFVDTTDVEGGPRRHDGRGRGSSTARPSAIRCSQVADIPALAALAKERGAQAGGGQHLQPHDRVAAAAGRATWWSTA